MLTKSGIYKITNLKNGNVYIGSSRDIWGRWRTHYNNLEWKKHCNEKLQADWNRYGEMNFTFEIISYCAPADFVVFEEFAISALKDQIGADKLLNINMVDKGINGERLTDHEAREIKQRVAAGAVKKRLAEEFNVSYSTIMNLCSGKTYSHISV